MTTVRELLAVGLAAILPVQAMAQGIKPCVSEEGAKSVVTFALPAMAHIAGDQCGKVLPPESGFTQKARALETQYLPDSDAAWPMARATIREALAKSGDNNQKNVMVKNLLDRDNPSSVRDMFSAFAETKPASPSTCGIVGHILPAVQPIAAKDFAGLITAIFEAISEQSEHGKGDFPIRFCPATPAHTDDIK